MLPRTVGYARPSSLAEALGLLAELDGTRALAGGQTLVSVMKARAASPDALVDLATIEELRGIELRPDGGLEIGAMTTLAEIAASPEARARPVLPEVVVQIADTQVRNRGTIGGNICANDPTNHLPPLMVALAAEMTIIGPGAERTVSADDFFLGVYMTAVAPGELLTRVTIPPGRRDGFASVTIGAEGTCIVSAAASLEREPGSRSAASTPSPIGRASSKHASARGWATSRLARRRGNSARPSTPPFDVHGSSEYRRALAEVVVARAIAQAHERGGR